ncbi:MAG TPA: MBL fold metallo-hydrolase [Candidatus Dormibacteraeota bacterium]|nr:MBL fold metallo-hydrolase [Candidatus Dormibacteraeota bacterium]
MDITWLGGNSLLLKGRETRVLLAPLGADAQTNTRAGADIVVGFTAGENVLRPDSGAQMVARPGEYELRGVSVRGVSVTAGTVFVTELDEVSVCNFGDQSTEISDEALEALGFIDVLGIGLDGGSAARAMAVAQLLTRARPAVCIPTGYVSALDAAPGELAAFVKEMGLAQVTPQGKLTLSGSSGSADDTRVVVLEPRR